MVEWPVSVRFGMRTMSRVWSPNSKSLIFFRKWHQISGIHWSASNLVSKTVVIAKRNGLRHRNARQWDTVLISGTRGCKTSLFPRIAPLIASGLTAIVPSQTYVPITRTGHSFHIRVYRSVWPIVTGRNYVVATLAETENYNFPAV